MVIRARINKLDYVQYLIGNIEGSGSTIYIDENYLLRMSVHVNGSYHGARSLMPIDVGTWHTIIGTYDGKVFKVYLDGEDVTNDDLATNIVGNITISPMPIIIGGNPSDPIDTPKAAVPAYATFSDALIFDRALTAEEIKKNYSKIPDPQNKTDLIAWYKFSS